jgi:hypothetical protein
LWSTPGRVLARDRRRRVARAAVDDDDLVAPRDAREAGAICVASS